MLTKNLATLQLLGPSRDWLHRKMGMQAGRRPVEPNVRRESPLTVHTTDSVSSLNFSDIVSMPGLGSQTLCAAYWQSIRTLQVQSGCLDCRARSTLRTEQALVGFHKGFRRPHLVVDGGSCRGEPGTHDVRSRQHEFDRPSVDPHLLHHVRVLMEESERREPVAVPIAEEQGPVVEHEDLRSVGTARRTTWHSIVMPFRTPPRTECMCNAADM